MYGRTIHSLIILLPRMVAGYSGFITLVIHVSVQRPYYFDLLTKIYVNISNYSSDLVYILLLLRSGLGLEMRISSIFGRIICLPHDVGVLIVSRLYFHTGMVYEAVSYYRQFPNHQCKEVGHSAVSWLLEVVYGANTVTVIDTED